MSKGDERMIKLNTFIDVETTVQLPQDDESDLSPELFAKKCTVSSEDIAKNESDKNELNKTVVNDVKNSTNHLINKDLDEQSEKSVVEIISPAKNSNRGSKYFRPIVPKINCTERIIFCLDMSSEMELSPFKLGDGTQHSTLSMVKRTVQLFVENKHFINRKHEFSLMVLYENATWVREFTNDPKEFIDSLEDLNETQFCSTCDLASIVSLLIEKYEMQIPKKLSMLPCILRVILMYGRSNCMIHFGSKEAKEFLINYPFLFLDVVYIHDPPSGENKCQEIFEAFCDLDEHNKSYIYEIATNTTKLHNSMAKLLAHPMQRCAQKDNAYLVRLPLSDEAD